MLRKLILRVIAIVFALTGPAGATPAGATNDTVRVEGGLISVSVVDDVRIYKGRPFAAPPVCELRWKSPQPVTAWDGVCKCDDFRPNCPQAPYSQSSLYYSAPHKQSEDCLYLDVWPAAQTAEKRPFMVWLYGGALTRGSGATRAYDARTRSRKRHSPGVISSRGQSESQAAARPARLYASETGGDDLRCALPRRE